MTPGVTEETGQTARSIVSGLSSQPLTLALVVLNCVFIAAIYWAGSAMRSQQHEVIQALVAQTKQTHDDTQLMVNSLLDRWKATQEMLAKCVLPKSPP